MMTHLSSSFIGCPRFASSNVTVVVVVVVVELPRKPLELSVVTISTGAAS